MLKLFEKLNADMMRSGLNSMKASARLYGVALSQRRRSRLKDTGECRGLFGNGCMSSE
jgi:hypothetical protein